MGDEHDWNLQRAQVLSQFFAQCISQISIEGGKRLVEQQQAGFDHERAGQSDTLLLATGNLAWASIPFLSQTETLQHFVDALAALALRCGLQTIANVVCDTQVWE